MDDDLRQKFAPRRNRRYAHLRGFNDDAAWAEALDWKDNDYAFYRLFHCILDRLDLEYREECGVRLGQLADTEELLGLARIHSAHYRREEDRYQILGIYSYLFVSVRIELGERLRPLLAARRHLTEDFAS